MADGGGKESTYSSIGSLLVLVPLLVGSGLGLVRGAVLFVEGLPLLAQLLADLALNHKISKS
jgi:hypothetical protein